MHVGQTSDASYSSKYLSFSISKQNYKLPLQLSQVYFQSILIIKFKTFYTFNNTI